MSQRTTLTRVGAFAATVAVSLCLGPAAALALENGISIKDASVIYSEQESTAEAQAFNALVAQALTDGQVDGSKHEVRYKVEGGGKLSPEAEAALESAIKDNLPKIRSALKQTSEYGNAGWLERMAIDLALPSVTANTFSNSIVDALNNASGDDVAAWLPLSGGEASVPFDVLKNAKIKIAAGLYSFAYSGINGLDQIVREALANEVTEHGSVQTGTHEVQLFENGVDVSDEANLTVTKAPVRANVTSGSIKVTDSLPALGAIRTDNGKPVDVDSFALYAGITADAQVLLSLDLPQAVLDDVKILGDMTIFDALKFIGLNFDKGVSLSELLVNMDKLQGIIGQIPGMGDVNIESLINDLLKQLAGSITQNPEQLEQILGLLESEQVTQAIQKIIDAATKGLPELAQLTGIDATVRLGTPEGTAGAYVVGSYLAESALYEAKGQGALDVGGLFVGYHSIPLTVNNGTYAKGELPNVVTINDPAAQGANLLTAYLGITSGATSELYLDVPQAYQYKGVTTLGELRKAVAQDPGTALDSVGFKSGIYEKLLTALADAETFVDSLPVVYGTPVEMPGAYLVASMAYKPGYGYGMATGAVTVQLGSTKVTVNSQEIHAGQEPVDFVQVEAGAELNKAVLLVGLTSDFKAAVHLVGNEQTNLANISTLGELRKALANSTQDVLGFSGVNNKHLADLLSRILDWETSLSKKLDQVKITMGYPQTGGTFRAYAFVGGPAHELSMAKGWLSVERHKEVEMEQIDPTCTVPGQEEGVWCESGQHWISGGEVIDPLGHQAEVIPGYPATCTETGLTAGEKCAVDGTILVEQEVIPALDHDWGEWVVTKEPTEDTPGERQRVCAHDSKHIETEPIKYEPPVVEPNPEEPIVPPTGGDTDNNNGGNTGGDNGSTDDNTNNGGNTGGTPGTNGGNNTGSNGGNAGTNGGNNSGGSTGGTTNGGVNAGTNSGNAGSAGGSNSGSSAGNGATNNAGSNAGITGGNSISGVTAGTVSSGIAAQDSGAAESADTDASTEATLAAPEEIADSETPATQGAAETGMTEAERAAEDGARGFNPIGVIVAAASALGALLIAIIALVRRKNQQDAEA